MNQNQGKAARPVRALCPSLAVTCRHTLHPTPYTLHPTPYTLHPTPCILHLAPFSLRRAPSITPPLPPARASRSHQEGLDCAVMLLSSGCSTERTPRLTTHAPPLTLPPLARHY